MTLALAAVALAAVALAAAVALLVRRRIRAADALWEGPEAGFFAFQQHLAGETGLAVNPEADALSLVRLGRPARLYAAGQLVGVEVVEDGAVVMRRERDGAWDGWERDHELATLHACVSRLELRVSVEDPAGPVHVVGFLHRPVRKDSSVYREAVGEIVHWVRVVGTMLARARTGQFPTAAPATIIPAATVEAPESRPPPNSATSTVEASGVR